MAESYRTQSPEETQAIGVRLGQNLKPGDIVALIGDLGAGKTCLTQGIARGAKIDSNQIVNSPSYTLINEYEGEIPIYHIDLYRLQRREEILDLGLEVYFEGNGICIIEWADRMLDLLPEGYMEIKLNWEDEFVRTIEFNP
ncbi:MAG: tRNA (adenosine(37)-N6)-threonylcarbamoyltransferase complex ATPase subunit type 1 TsaE [Candidatus Poribacteria bacterium]|nr:tRNA (adenosine(37)-N6)-threonylcarbamoyltransferase complex ATPase subunit type 1 TsaE [Candidatus Poribacteria bacterium]